MHAPGPAAESGLFDHARPAGEPARFSIDAGAGLLLGANSAGAALWGLDPAGADLPLTLDGAMPGLQQLRRLTEDPAPLPSSREANLIFWTPRGTLRLAARIEPEAASPGRLWLTACGAGPSPAADDAAAGEDRSLPRAQTQPQVGPGAWLAHELRTPLGAVIAYAEILKDEHFGPIANARYKGYARDIYDSARHALSVVDSLLRGGSGHSLVPPLAVAELDPLRVVDSCLTVARPLAERAGLRLGTRSPPSTPRIIADELTLKQMLLNLLTNAVKFARPGDSITIEITCDGSGTLSIAVADTGPGMALDDAQMPCAAGGVDRAARHAAAGLGLGLPLTRALAAANGAAFAIDSAPGRGTRATIAFGPTRVVSRNAQ